MSLDQTIEQTLAWAVNAFRQGETRTFVAGVIECRLDGVA